jgi:hypothetical protein
MHAIAFFGPVVLLGLALSVGLVGLWRLLTLPRPEPAGYRLRNMERRAHRDYVEHRRVECQREIAQLWDRR